MKFVQPKEMTDRESLAYELCLSSSGIVPLESDVIASISANMGAIENGVEVLDQKLPIPLMGEVDIVASDKDGNLLFVDVEDTLDAASVCKILMRVDWASANCEMFGHFHQSLNLKGRVRSWCFVRELATGVNSILKRMKNDLLPDIFKYHCFNFNDSKWVVAHRYFVDAQAPKVDRENVRPLKMNSVLTDREIGDFFTTSNFEVMDEVTSKYSM